MKKDIGRTNALYPSLTTIVGAVVDGKPNFLAVAHVGILNHGDPQYLSFGLAKIHYTNSGIHENKEFSVNIPSENLMVETDYVGIVTGKNSDKSKLFDLFYGELPNAPMIRTCPVTMECRLHQVVDFPTHDIFVGEVVKTHADENCLGPDGKIDVLKVKPLLFDMSSVKYYSLGPALGGCWNVGKKLKNRE